MLSVLPNQRFNHWHNEDQLESGSSGSVVVVVKEPKSTASCNNRYSPDLVVTCNAEYTVTVYGNAR